MRRKHATCDKIALCKRAHSGFNYLSTACNSLISHKHLHSAFLSHVACFWPRTHGNVFLRFCLVPSNELVVLDSLENSKQYKNAGKRFRVYDAFVASCERAFSVNDDNLLF